MKEAPVKRGDVLAGKYRVESVLGVGGMGVVIAVTHLELLETRAIKLMLPEAMESAESVERFLREGRAASRLQSEHVARVHDVGRLDGGAPYMVMEYLAGMDLRAVLRQRGRIPASEAALYALQACEALAEAHARGIVHRDLKPANLFLTSRRDGSPCIKVLDFGISKVRSESDPEMTTTQAVLGSPTYMSPEQMRSARSVDGRTDVWSLGVILYRLVTAQPPFLAENITELVALVLSSTPEPPSELAADVPDGFDDVVLRCLERDREKRWQSVGDLAAALAPFVPEESRRSVDRISRLLSGAGAIRSVPPPRGPKSGPPRASTGSHPAWASTPLGGESISMRRWTFVALAAIAAGLAVAGMVALVISVRLGRHHTAAHEAPRASGPVPVAASPVEARAPIVEPFRTPLLPPSVPETAPVGSETPTAPAREQERRSPPPQPRAPPIRGRSPARAPSADPPSPPVPPPSSTAPHRMFGIDF
ncbi:Serine/threonine-protein kinase pkn3 [Minicystis rosea]|nr:Serine/threonine-protein kinase pkn3 [Minicystis rosea]